jgi:CHAD domain-containing protein
VRDIDVFLASLSAPDSPVKLDARHSAQVEGMLTAERERRYREGVAALEKRKPKRVVRRVQKLAKRYGAGERGAGAAVVEAVRTMWRKRAEALLAAPVLEGEDVRLHPIRVNLKGLRYCTELLLRIGKGEDAALLARFRAMQERLGSWNDHVNAATRLSRLATEPKTIAVQTGWSKAVLEYSAARARAAERLVEEIRERWPTFRAAVEAAVTTYAEVRPEVQSRCGVSARTEA